MRYAVVIFVGCLLFPNVGFPNVGLAKVVLEDSRGAIVTCRNASDAWSNKWKHG